MIHKLTTTEQSFTATGAKLAAHWPIFQKLRDTGFASIIRATMTMHQVCSSRCSYCSTVKRNKKDAITFDEAINFVRQLYFKQGDFNFERFPDYNFEYRQLRGSDIRLRSLILSGGGQPNLWPQFAKFVDWLYIHTKIKLGLITNGFPLRVPEDAYEHFEWIRISVTPPEASAHYPNGRFDRQYIPETARSCKTVGYSYVVGPWTTDDDLLLLDRAAVDQGFAYARVLVDCNLPRSAQLQAHEELGARLERLGLVMPDGTPTSKVFHQLKVHGTPEEAIELWDEGQCYLQAYNVFWDTTGHEEHGRSFCYPCDSVTVLAEEPSELVRLAKPSERRFSPKWGTVPNDEVSKLFTEPLRPFFDPRKNCSACLFMKNNQTVKDLRDGVSDHLAAAGNIEHVDFP